VQPQATGTPGRRGRPRPPKRRSRREAKPRHREEPKGGPHEKTHRRRARRLPQARPAAQRAQLRGTKVERQFTIERDGAIDEKARTVWLSIASEAPYERWWGVEVLDMRKKSIRDARLKSGAPLLVGHDSADQVGVVESFEITSDKKLRVLARFGKRAGRGDLPDVLDGIRRNASVGYIIHDLVLEKQEEDVAHVPRHRLGALEGSLVAVPADHHRRRGPRVARAGPAHLNLPREMTPETRKTCARQIEAERAEARAGSAREGRAQEAPEARSASEARRRPHRRRRASTRTSAARRSPRRRSRSRRHRRELPREDAREDARQAEADPHRRARADRPALRRRRAPHHRQRRSCAAFTKPCIYSDGSKMEPIEAAYRSGSGCSPRSARTARAALVPDHGLGERHRAARRHHRRRHRRRLPRARRDGAVDHRPARAVRPRAAPHAPAPDVERHQVDPEALERRHRLLRPGGQLRA
jgi:hypothetical protein